MIASRAPTGPRGRDFNMRWIASLVAETYRILDPRRHLSLPGDRGRGYAKAGCG